jgi:hypothetical protein
MPSITHIADAPSNTFATPNYIAPHYCHMDRSCDLPTAVQAQLPALPPTRPVFAPLRNPGPTLPLHVPLLTRIDVDKNGDTVPSTTSEVIPIQHKKLDPHTPIFSTSAAKTAFVRTLPSAIQLQLEQPLARLLEGPSPKNSTSGSTFTGQHGSDTAANCDRLTPAISISIASNS